MSRWVRTLATRRPAFVRNRSTVRLIARSGLFDAAFYRELYPDVEQAGHDPVRHYVRHGADEGRNPHPLFDTNYYRSRHPDIVEAGWNPLAHFVVHGWLEGRNPSPHCDLAAHLERHGWDAATEPLATLLEVVASDQRERDVAAIESAPAISIRRLRATQRRDASRDRIRADDPVVVVVSHVCAVPPRQGNEYRVLRYLRWLESRGYQTLFVCCPLPGEELDEADLSLAARELSNFIYCDRRGEVAISLAAHLDPIVAGLEGTRATPFSPYEAQQCATEVELSADLAAMELVFCPDVLVRLLLHIDSRLPEPTTYMPNYVLSTRYLPLLQESRLKILDTIDVFSYKSEKVGAFGVDNSLEVSAQEERALLLRADVVMAIQPIEARILASLVPERRVIDVGIDFDTLPEDHLPEANAELPGGDVAQRVVMVGSANPMNVKGLDDLLTYVWPLVIREHPDAELWVAGAVSNFVPEESPNVTALGYVDSLDELYRGCRIVVNPAVAGTGLKIKTLECLAHWRPIVTWPAGVDGIANELRQHCVVVTDLYEFYLEISKALSQSPREAFSAEQRSRIRYCLSGLVTYRELEEVLADPRPLATRHTR